MEVTAYILRNTRNNQFLHVYSDDSECLETSLIHATLFENQDWATEAIEEHESFGPLIVVPIKLSI
jgi:hypothetical protein